MDIDSGFIMATASVGENSSMAVAHFFSMFSYMGLLHSIKTENGTAYTSKAFAAFCSKYAIHHLTGLAY